MILGRKTGFYSVLVTSVIGRPQALSSFRLRAGRLTENIPDRTESPTVVRTVYDCLCLCLLTITTAGEPSTFSPPPIQVYTVREVAKALKLSERKVWDLIKNGELKACRLRGNVRVRVRDVEEFLSQNPYEVAGKG